MIRKNKATYIVIYFLVFSLINFSASSTRLEARVLYIDSWYDPLLIQNVTYLKLVICPINY